MPAFDRLTMQIGKEPVFIAGDEKKDVPLLNEAADEGHIAGENAARYPDVKPGFRRTLLAVVFTDPQIAMVGQGPDKLVADSFVTGSVDFRGQGRSRVILKNKGVLHLYADRGSRRLLGAQMVGPSAEHLAHLLAWSVQQAMTIDQMLQMPFYHPVIEEGLRTALRDTAAKLDERVCA
jgi:dihydrolipoamide dehydrogenase